MSGLSASKDLRPNGRTNRGLVSAAAPEVSELDAIIGTRDQVLAAIKLQEWWRSRQQHQVSAEEDEEDATVADGETSAPAADAEMTADELQEIIRNKLLAAEGALERGLSHLKSTKGSNEQARPSPLKKTPSTMAIGNTPSGARLNRRRGAVTGRTTEPLMCGPLLKRGKHDGKWKLRWYTLSVDGELVCYRRHADLHEAKPPMFTVLVSQLRVTMLPPERMDAEAVNSGVFGFRLDGARSQRELFAETQEAFACWINAFALLGACAGAAVGATTESSEGALALAAALSPANGRHNAASARGGSGSLQMDDSVSASLPDSPAAARALSSVRHLRQKSGDAHDGAHGAHGVLTGLHDIHSNPGLHDIHSNASMSPRLSGSASPRGSGHAQGHVLDLCGFHLSGELAGAYFDWCAARSKEVKRNAKQHERWTQLLLQYLPAPPGPGPIGSNGSSSGGTQGSSSSSSNNNGGLADGRSSHPGSSGGEATHSGATLKHTRIKTQAIKGVPTMLRLRVWSALSGIQGLMSQYPTHYNDMLAVSARLHEEDKHEIEKDIGRTFPDHPLFTPLDAPPPAAPPQATPTTAATSSATSNTPSQPPRRTEPPGRTALRNVLMAYVAHNRGLGYCQALNYVGGMLLLLTELREAPAFFLLLHFSERCAAEAGLAPHRNLCNPPPLPPRPPPSPPRSCVTDFYSKYMNGIRVVQKLFEEYFRATVPRLAAHLDQQGMPLSIATTKWFMCLYVNTLPAETLLRVWDVLLVDGPEVLLRVGAALLKLNEPLLLTITDFIALSQELQSLGKGCWSADALLSVAYKQLASPPAARQALATLRRMQLVAHEVGGEAADGVREVRLREGLIPRTLRVGWLRPHRPLPVVPPTKLPPTSGDADAAQGSANATPDLNSPNLDAKEWLKQRAAERAAAAAVSAAPTALPLGPVDDGAGVGFESFTAPGSRMLRPLARRVSVDRPPLTDDALDALNGVPVATHTREGRPLPQTRGGSLDSSRWSTMTIEDEPDDADEDADSPSSVSPIDRGRTRQSAGLDRHRNR